MVRADRFIGSRIAESENEKFLWWAEGTKFSNVQCDWWARALGNMDLLPGVCHCTGIDKYALFHQCFGDRAFYNYTGRVEIL